jgi:hypothetical protein
MGMPGCSGEPGEVQHEALPDNYDIEEGELQDGGLAQLLGVLRVGEAGSPGRPDEPPVERQHDAAELEANANRGGDAGAATEIPDAGASGAEPTLIVGASVAEPTLPVGDSAQAAEQPGAREPDAVVAPAAAHELDAAAEAPGGRGEPAEQKPQRKNFAEWRKQQRAKAKQAQQQGEEQQQENAVVGHDTSLVVELPKEVKLAAPTAGGVGLVYSSEMERHVCPDGHVERPERHKWVVQQMRDGAAALCKPLPPRPATDEELQRVHPPEHVAAVEAMWDPQSEEQPVQQTGDMYFSESTAAAARLSAGCAVAAAEAVASGATRRAFAVVRPPGHHAECARAGGLCALSLQGSGSLCLDF